MPGLVAGLWEGVSLSFKVMVALYLDEYNGISCLIVPIGR
jgi:hypothetical protein